jgi:membrane-associated protease RseP (regulator of RpoE activity)
MSSLEEIEPDDEPRAYRNQPFGKRIIVASAGSAMHFLMALLLAFLALTLLGRSTPSVVTVQGYISFDGGAVTPAKVGGLLPGDQIVSVAGHKVTSPSSLSAVVHGSAGKPVTLVVERDGADKTLHVTPVDGRKVEVDGQPLAKVSGPSTGYLGIDLGEGTARVGPAAALGQSATLVAQVTHAAVSGIAHLFSPVGLTNYAREVIHPAAAPSSSASSSAVASSPAENRPESIVGAVRTATQGVQAGALTFIEVLISLNIFIGLINMLPMLPLDGGHVAIAAYEWVRTRRGRPRYQADVAKMMPVAYAFVAFLLVLVSTSLYLDLTHPIANPFR